MICGVTRLNRDERSAASGSNLIVRHYFSFDNCAICRRFDDARPQVERLVSGRRSQELYAVLRRDGAWWLVGLIALHEKVRSCPVAVTIE
jgi:hypothetical protein